MNKTLMLVCFVPLGSFLAACSGGDTADSSVESPGDVAPAGVADAWRPIIGEYAEGADTVSVLEDGGTLVLLPWNEDAQELTGTSDSTFSAASGAAVVVRRGADAGVDALSVDDRVFSRLSLGAEDGGTFRITPIRAADELLAHLVDAEWDDRHNRKMNKLMKFTKSAKGLKVRLCI